MTILPLGDFFPVYDANGKQYSICCFATFQDDTKNIGMFEPQPPPYFETSDKKRVESLGKGRYRIIDQNIELTLKNPKA
jgi:hypothetical protein